MPGNSRISAAAVKQLFWADSTTSARGGSFSSAASRPSSSSSTEPESTLAELPGLSNVSQATPSASRSRVQLRAESLLMVEALGGRDRGLLRTGAAAGIDAEVAHQRPMIREAHVGHAEARDLDPFAHQDEIELDARHARREGGQACGVGAAQPGGAHEQEQLVRAPEGVEVAGDDRRLGRLHDQIVQRTQLVLAVAEFHRQVNQENVNVGEVHVYD